MTAQDKLTEIIKKTVIIKNILKAKKLDIALIALEERKSSIENFLETEDLPNDAVKPMLKKFKVENDACIEAMRQLKTSYEKELYQNKMKKNEVHFAGKVKQQYKMAEAFLVGNRFDSKKKY